MGNPGARTSSSWTPALAQPARGPASGGGRRAQLPGARRDSGRPGRAERARRGRRSVADMLGAPVAKALLGKAVLPDDSPFTTGGIGDLGTAPSSWAMKTCDTVLILGSTMPWDEYYPTPGQARGVQVDLKPDRIGLRYPVEVGLDRRRQGDAAGAVAAASAQDRPRLPAARRSSGWPTGTRCSTRSKTTARSPLRPADGDPRGERPDGRRRGDLARLRRQHPFRRALHPAARESAADRHRHAGDDGAGTALRDRRASWPIRSRQSVAIVGDGGFAMLMAELTTAVAHDLPVKIILLKNNASRR